MNTAPALTFFNEPVDPDALGIPEYRDVIKTPMDLGTISERVKHGHYESAAAVKADVALVVANAKLFNAAPDHPVAVAADKLAAAADGMWKTMKLDAAAERAERAAAEPPPPPPRPAAKPRPKLPPPASQPTVFDWRSRAAAVIDLVRSQCAAAAPFLQPVDVIGLGLTDYLSIVPHPMDLGTMATRLAADAVAVAAGGGPAFYASPEGVAVDAALTFENCRRYNAPGTPIVAAADAAEASFVAAWATAGLAGVRGGAPVAKPAVAKRLPLPSPPSTAAAASPSAKKPRPSSASGRCAVCRVARRGGCGTSTAARGCERAGQGPPPRAAGGGGGTGSPSEDPFKLPPRAPPPLSPVDSRPTPAEAAALAAAADLAATRAAADAAVRAADAAARAAARRVSTAGTLERRAAAAEAAHRGALDAAPAELWAPAEVVPAAVQEAAAAAPPAAREELPPRAVAALFGPGVGAAAVAPSTTPSDAVTGAEVAALFAGYAAPVIKSGE